jgi:hypothetical protein
MSEQDPVDLAREVAAGKYTAVADEVEQVTEERLAIEPDGAFPQDREGIWRLVTAAAQKRRREQQCSARPNYEATVYTLKYAKVLSRAPAIIPDLIRTAETLASAYLEMCRDYRYLQEVRGPSICQCGDDEACRFVRERDAALAEVEQHRKALESANATIEAIHAAGNGKVSGCPACEAADNGNEATKEA